MLRGMEGGVAVQNGNRCTLRQAVFRSNHRVSCSSETMPPARLELPIETTLIPVAIYRVTLTNVIS